jgi:hypothetical protein
MNRESLADFLRPVARYSDWILLAGIGALALGLAWWVAASARGVTTDARAETRKAEHAAAVAGGMRARFVPAGSEEIQEWDRSRAEVAEFGAPPQMRVALAQIVTRAAEDAGVTRVRTRFAPPDSVVSPLPRTVAGQEFIGAPYAIMLQGVGDAGAAGRLLMTLPWAVNVQRLEMADDELTFFFSVYQPGQVAP